MSLPFSPGLVRAPVWIRKATATAEAPPSLVNFVMPNATSDAAPAIFTLISGHAYAQASSNTTGADLRLAPGIGRRFITVDDYAQAGTGTVTVTVNGTATVLTAGTDFTAATSNAVTATNLATAIEAIAGVSATAVSAVVYVTPDDSTYTLTLARSVAAFATVTSGTDGNLTLALGQLIFTTGVGLKNAASGVLGVTDGSTGEGALVTGAHGTALAYLSSGSRLGVISSSTNATFMEFRNTSTGGRNWVFGTTGSAHGWGAGHFALYDTTATEAGSQMALTGGGGAGLLLTSAGRYAWGAANPLGSATADTNIARADAATPYFYGSSTAVGATVRLGNTNVGYEDIARNTEAHTLAAAGTSTTATAVWPANSSSLAATFRITTEITGCTSVQVGVSGDVTRYGTFSTLTAGQTIAIGRIDNYAAQTGILFTAVGGGASFTAGVIRVNLRYVTASAPTS